MKKRQFIFIFALTFLSVIIWIVGEFLIGQFINSFGFSVGWAIFCLVACCAYSLWKCPREPDEEDKKDEAQEETEQKQNQKGDK
ncbi:MAG: hypothetical protein K2H66_03660 [Oscillospiraceae bacterium]|nr:hypothetical protein [Oscillospiraceae bacterium]MDE6657169.1 hypothetical protein [Oscillospiraceae bacterium]